MPTVWIILAILVIVVIFFAELVRRGDALADQQRQIAERRIDLDARLCDVFDKYEDPLIIRLHQLAYKDAYGEWVFDKWDKELRYFFDRFVVPALPNPTPAEKKRLYRELSHYVDGSGLDISAETQCVALPNSDGIAYERAVGAILAKGGYIVTYTQTTGDQGVDIIAERGADKLAVQCKCYKGPVGNSAVQEVYAGARYYGITDAYVVAPSGFTVSARQLAASLNVRCMHHNELSAVVDMMLSFPNE